MVDVNVNKLIQDNLAAFYGYAYDKLYDKDKATDLAHEIIVEILDSIENLRDEKAFWGFSWKIAENTFRKFIRREELKRKTELAVKIVPSEITASPEYEYIDREDAQDGIYILRRELSLLAKTHRDICLAYYVDNKSCSEISEEQGISVDMVKYHLFRIRKQLKEGIGMTRELGKRSYKPDAFRLDFWGDYNRYYHLFDRKLPGNILLAAYDEPLRAEELSVELGVAMPYLEDEIKILEAAGVLRRVGKKYQTNVVIITDKCAEKIEEEMPRVCKQSAQRIFDTAKELLPKIRELDFKGNDYDDNRLLFAILNTALVNGFHRAEYSSAYGTPKPLALGGNGWVWGVGDADNEAYNHFAGVTIHTPNKSGTAWFSAENYMAIISCQLYDHSRFKERAEAVCDAVLERQADRKNETLPWLIEQGFIFSDSGKLRANFPVFTNEVFTRLLDILEPMIEESAKCMISFSDKAAEILEDGAPGTLKDKCLPIAKISYRLNTAAYVFEELIDSGRLYLPKEKTPLCMWGVIN